MSGDSSATHFPRVHFPDKNETERLRAENARLKGLVETFTLLNSSLDLDTVLMNTLKTATKLMHAAVGSIALINEERTHLEFVESTDENFDRLKNMKVPLGEGVAGTVALTGKAERVADMSRDSRFYQKIDDALGTKTSSYLCVPLFVNKEVIGTAQIMNRLDGKPFTEEDKDLLLHFAEQAALAINNARLHGIMLKQEAIESELRVCGDIQNKLFPESLPHVDGYEVFGRSVPHREVGGDYYTFNPRHDGTTDAIIGDVSGKGLSAALMVSELHTGIHLLSQIEGSLKSHVNTLNLHLHESLIMGKFITLFAARLHGDGTVEYVLAGHPPPPIISRDGTVRWLNRTGPVLGIGPNEIRSETIAMHPGDLLVSFSDGYSETMNPEGDMFDEERIAEVVTRWHDLPLNEIADNLDAVLAEFSQGQPPADDATLLFFRRL